MLQIALDTAQFGGELGILHNRLGDLHVRDLALAAVVQRNQIDRGGHVAQLAGKRAQHRRRRLLVMERKGWSRQNEWEAPWR